MKSINRRYPNQDFPEPNPTRKELIFDMPIPEPHDDWWRNERMVRKIKIKEGEENGIHKCKS